MSNPNHPDEDPAFSSSQPLSQTPWAWEGPQSSTQSQGLASRSKIVGAAVMQAKGPDPSIILNSISPWGRFGLIFVLGLVLGGTGGYFYSHLKPSSQANVKTVVAQPTPVPAALGSYTVTGIQALNIMAIDSNGSPVLIHTTSATSYQRDGLVGRFSEIVPGLHITAKGKTGTEFSRIVGRILIQDASITGQIQSISSNTIIVSVSTGVTLTIDITPTTPIQNTSTHQLVAQSSLHTNGKITVYGLMLATGAFSAIVVDMS